MVPQGFHSKNKSGRWRIGSKSFDKELCRENRPTPEYFVDRQRGQRPVFRLLWR